MDDKVRIEKLVQTLMLIKGTISFLKESSSEGHVKEDADKIMRTIEFVIQANADQIKTPV